VRASAGGRSLPAEEALPAKHRTALGGLERDRSFPSALGTGGHGFGLLITASAALAFRFTSLATLRLVFEILVVEEVLLPRCENEFCSAIRALEYTILKFRH